MGNETQAFADSRGIKFLNPTPYYAQVNGQAEVTNKMIINIIKKMVKKNPSNGDTMLSKALWAYQTSKRSSTGLHRLCELMVMVLCWLRMLLLGLQEEPCRIF